VIADYETIKDDSLRVMGLVKKGSLHWFPRETKLEFQITDDTEQIVLVEYTGAKPDMLREGQGVVVEGNLSGPGKLLAETLLVKHSEEYKATEHTGKKEDYYKTLNP
jgi:cytochrome c-type biogenesis protein CcmE